MTNVLRSSSVRAIFIALLLMGAVVLPGCNLLGGTDTANAPFLGTWTETQTDEFSGATLNNSVELTENTIEINVTIGLGEEAKAQAQELAESLGDAAGEELASLTNFEDTTLTIKGDYTLDESNEDENSYTISLENVTAESSNEDLLNPQDLLDELQAEGEVPRMVLKVNENTLEVYDEGGSVPVFTVTKQ